MCCPHVEKVPVLPSYRNQSIDLQSKSIDWFLYEAPNGLMLDISIPYPLSIIVRPK